LGLAPSRCLAIEDTERGVRSATAAGMTCIAIPNELSEAGDFAPAFAILDSMDELPELLRGS
jgi:beta-phosphoglucomutase-like phosphatase (HAD superfamily)